MGKGMKPSRWFMFKQALRRFVFGPSCRDVLPDGSSLYAQNTIPHKPIINVTPQRSRFPLL